MDSFSERALTAFRRALRVPAYHVLLREAAVDPSAVVDLESFRKLPVSNKRNTFERFPIEQLCVDGELGELGWVLTSSGHSGVFAFGLTESGTLPGITRWVDNVLDVLFQVRTHRTLLINCLPMGVKVPTEICTLADVSVRPDMAVGLVKAFGRHYRQIVLVGETAFIKHVLELGLRSGVDWRTPRVSVIVGEEPLAENARKYIESIVGVNRDARDSGLVVSSMGVAELGLNLFYEVPPHGALLKLRRLLHDHAALRSQVLGYKTTWVPSLFTYDPERIYVEFDDAGQLLITTVDPFVRIPLIRYQTGDYGTFVRLVPEWRADLERAGVLWESLQDLTILAVRGRGECAYAGTMPVYPEAVKEGIYHEPALVPLTTANFRIRSGSEQAQVRIQLTPGILASSELDERFRQAIAPYVEAPFRVTAETYETFGSGMALDYERKFKYLGP